MKLSITFAIVVALSYNHRASGATNSTANFTQAHYCSPARLANFSVGGLLPMFPNIIVATYPKTKARVCMGNELNVSDVQYAPLVSWPSDPNKFYTMCMFDPDCPSSSNPRLSPFNHWLVGNIRGNNFTRADNLSEYTPPNPSETTGLHRFYFLVHEQPSWLVFDEPFQPRDDVDDRFIFKYWEFLEKYKLRGNLVAGNYFIAQYAPKPKPKSNDTRKPKTG